MLGSRTENESRIAIINFMLQNTNEVSMMALREIHPKMRTDIQYHIPEIKLKKVEVTEAANAFQLDMQTTDGSVKIDYIDQEDIVVVKFEDKEKLIENAMVSKVALSDLELILRHQKENIEQVSIMFSTTQNEYFLDNLQHYLASRKEKLQMGNFSMFAINTDQIFKIFRFIYANTEFNFVKFQGDSRETWNFNRLADLPQWRHARKCSIDGILVSLPIEDFLHFSNVLVDVNSISANDLLILRQTALTSSRFNIFIIGYKKLIDEGFLNEAFGPWFQDRTDPNGEIRKWYFTGAKIDYAIEVTHMKQEWFKIVKIQLDAAPKKLIVVA